MRHSRGTVRTTSTTNTTSTTSMSSTTSSTSNTININHTTSTIELDNKFEIYKRVHKSGLNYYNYFFIKALAAIY